MIPPDMKWLSLKRRIQRMAQLTFKRMSIRERTEMKNLVPFFINLAIANPIETKAASMLKGKGRVISP